MGTVPAYVLLLMVWPLVSSGQTGNKRSENYEVEESIKRYGISEEQLGKLKAAGIDLGEAWEGPGKLNEKARAVFSDLVVLGQVQELVDTPGPWTQPFHSKVLVQVERVLKGKLEGTAVIELSRYGGPVDSAGSLWSSTDVKLKPGERVLLFCHKPEKDPFVMTKFKRYVEGNKDGFASNAFITGQHSCFFVRNAKIRLYRLEKDVNEVARNVMAVDSILNIR